MKINHKQMFLMLKAQEKSLKEQLAPAVNVEKVNEVPENFNQIGWDITIEKVETMLTKMKELREMKGNRLTPQFYRSIYNRALIANNEIDKLQETLQTDSLELDFQAECVKLTAQIAQLNIQVAEKAAKDAAEAAEREATEKAEAEKAAKEAEKAAKEAEAAGKSK